MAKDLPYFKFFCSEWSDGDITLEDYETQGVFINVCAYYWSKEGNVSYDNLLKKFRHAKKIVIELTKNNFIKVKEKDNSIYIGFLDEQFKERKSLSKKNADNARKRWGSKEERPHSDRNTTASHSQCQNDAIKRREEKKRKEKKREDLLNNFSWIDDVAKRKSLDVERVKIYLGTFVDDLIAKDDFDKEIREVKRHFVNWLNKQDTKKKPGRATFNNPII